MKKLNKILCILLMMICIFSIPSEVYATGIIDIFGAGKIFIQEGMEELTLEFDDIFNPDGLIGKASKTLGKWLAKDIFMNIIDALWAIGLLVVFISTVVLGIKYMFVLPQEKSRLKQATTPYLIGVVAIFGALTIWRFLIMVLDGSIM